MESPAGANASSAGGVTPAAAQPPSCASPPQGDRKRGRAAWAAEQHAANRAFRQQHMEESEDHDVDIKVVDGDACVLCDGVFYDLRQGEAALYGTLLHAVKDEIDFTCGYQFMYTDSRDNKRKLSSAADYGLFQRDVLAREVRPRGAPVSRSATPVRRGGPVRPCERTGVAARARLWNPPSLTLLFHRPRAVSPSSLLRRCLARCLTPRYKSAACFARRSRLAVWARRTRTTSQ